MLLPWRVWLEAVAGQQMPHERNLLETKAALLVTKGATFVPSKKSTHPCVMVFVCSTPNDYIICNAVGSLKAFKSIM